MNDSIYQVKAPSVVGSVASCYDGAFCLSADLVASYIDFAQVSEKSQKTYLKAIRQFARYLDAKEITKPVRADFIAFRDYLKATKSANTTCLYVNATKSFFKWCNTQGIYQDITINVKGAKVSSDFKKDPLTHEQEMDLLKSINLESIQGLRDYAIVRLMLTAGLRTIEIQRAKVSDIINAWGNTYLLVWGKGHDGNDERIELAPKAEKAIREYLKARGTVAEDDPLFASHSDRDNGSAMRVESISRIIKTHLRAIGIDSKRITAHSLRHTCITQILANGGTLEEASEVARHKDIATTKRYQHFNTRANNHSETMLDSLLDD